MVELDPEVADRLAQFAAAPPGPPLDIDELARRAGVRRRRRRVAGGLVAAAAVVVGGLAVGALVTGDGSPGHVDVAGDVEPAATLSPDDGLADGEVVEVRAVGLPETSSAAMCAADATAATVGSRCDARTMTPVEAAAPGSATFRVVRAIEVGGEARDCADPETPCAVAVGVVDGPVVVVPVAFSAERAASAPPTLSLASASGSAPTLRDGDVVPVRGAGFAPGREVPVVQCEGAPGDEGCTSLTTATFVADGDGAFTGDVRVSRRLDTPAGATDCASSPCRLVAETPTSGPVGVALAFAPAEGPLAEPRLEVSPAGPHRAGQAVTVTGAGFPAGAGIEVTICAGPVDVDPGERSCVGQGASFTTTDSSGAFVIDPYVLALDGLDCAAGCYVAYAPMHYPVLAYAPLDTSP